MDGLRTEADTHKNEYFNAPFTDWLSFPSEEAMAMIQNEMYADPDSVRTDARVNQNLFLRLEDKASPLYCSVVRSRIVRGRPLYTLRDEQEKLHKSRLMISDTVNPEHIAYDKIRAMTLDDAKTALFKILDEQYNYNSENDPDTEASKRIFFRYMVHSILVFDRITYLMEVQKGRVIQSGDNKQLNAHLLSILHLFLRTHQLFDPRLQSQGKQQHIGITREAAAKFVLATIANRMFVGPTYKFTKNISSINEVSKAERFTETRGPKAFLYFVTDDFHDSYRNAFRSLRIRAASVQIKVTRTNLLQKKQKPMYETQTAQQRVRQLPSCSSCLYYHHYRVFDLLWEGFEAAYLNNAFNVLGIASSANCYNQTQRFMLLSNWDRHDMQTRDDQLWVIFPNENMHNQNPWV